MSSLEELQKLIHKKYGIEPSALDPNGSMREHGIDSLALVEFLFDVEDKFKVSLQSYPDIDTLAQLAQAIDELRAAQAA
ncbi:acyl carrier protein [Pseudorhodoferax sp.]|uniref:acyl carrier protein n=1 Tax=Pseudorhodoferax sp. TaxID=1993553 RepID=UPI002DD63297|nr:acyl carrier protein [Pseudorhodoferax sp.]